LTSPIIIADIGKLYAVQFPQHQWQSGQQLSKGVPAGDQKPGGSKADWHQWSRTKRPAAHVSQPIGVLCTPASG